jgi:hypothetical protein
VVRLREPVDAACLSLWLLPRWSLRLAADALAKCACLVLDSDDAEGGEIQLAEEAERGERGEEGADSVLASGAAASAERLRRLRRLGGAALRSQVAEWQARLRWFKAAREAWPVEFADWRVAHDVYSKTPLLFARKMAAAGAHAVALQAAAAAAATAMEPQQRAELLTELRAGRLRAVLAASPARGGGDPFETLCPPIQVPKIATDLEISIS